MKTVIGILMVLGGVVLGLYLGLWVCFVGGIVGIIEAIRAPEVIAMDVAISVVKIIFAAAVGQISALFLVIPGLAIIK